MTKDRQLHAKLDAHLIDLPDEGYAVFISDLADTRPLILDISLEQTSEYLSDSEKTSRARSISKETEKIRKETALLEYLTKLSVPPIGCRLFSLRGIDGKVLCNFKGSQVYFLSRKDAREARDHLRVSFMTESLITKGPDHRDFDLPPQ